MQEVALAVMGESPRGLTKRVLLGMEDIFLPRAAEFVFASPSLLPPRVFCLLLPPLWVFISFHFYLRDKLSHS